MPRLQAMRIFGKRVSNLWLLLLLPFAILLIPGLLGMFFVANNLAGAIFGPPALWNRPSRTPDQAEMVGRYVETKRIWNVKGDGVKAVLELKLDGTMTVHDLPDDRITNVCRLSGSGTWHLSDRAIDLNFKTDGAPNDCESAKMRANPQIAGRSKPHKLYWILGDPDSGEGIWLQRR